MAAAHCSCGYAVDENGGNRTFFAGVAVNVNTQLQQRKLITMPSTLWRVAAAV